MRLEIIDFDKAAIFLVLAVPGIIILYVRSQFLTGRFLSIADGLLTYVTVSLVYYALAFPILGWLDTVQPVKLPTGFGWVALVLLGPALVGILLGLSASKGWVQNLLRRIGITTVHPINSAWDWRFACGPTCWTLIVLKDGTRWAGYLGPKSFISSDPAERDIYIQQVYEIDDECNWKARNSSVLITHGEIQSLEFWPDATTPQQEETEK